MTNYQLRLALVSTTSALALAFATATPTYAQNENQNAQITEELVVTGSRIVREGYEAPTPLEVVGVEQMQSQAGGNVASLLNNMPVFSRNNAPNSFNVNSNPTSGLTGLNLLNIRGLGPNRSLVLLDGQRVVPVLTIGVVTTNAVDISGIPQQLISRIETVTGGASAVYGSDAVGGVTNFILDKTFTGFKGDVSGGVTSYGDNRNWKVDLSAGFGFAGDRGHVILSGELYAKDQILDSSARKWNYQSLCVMQNPAYTPTNGLPFRINVRDCGETSAPGGVINTGPLKGTTFGQGGVPQPFIYGLASGSLMSGGSWELARDMRFKKGAALDPGEKRQNIFGRVSYNLTDTINMAYTYSWGHTRSDTRTQTQFNDAPGITIKSDNAFIPASLRPALAAAGTTSFVLSTLNGDIPSISTFNNRFIMRNALSIDGAVDMFGGEWSWNAYYQHGVSRNSLNALSTYRSRYNNAVDAVTDSAGRIVCRINVDSTTANDDPACVPYNLFGVGVNSPGVYGYIGGLGHVKQTNIQQVWAATLTGEPISLWAGPVSLALNAEYRRESTHGLANAPALANDLFSGSYKHVIGKLNVKEASIETVVPLARGEVWSDNWDVQLAARATDYSSSGYVTTWKVGSTYALSDFRIRGNVSRDIRAGNLGELFSFAGAPQFQGGGNDPFTNTPTTPRVASSGNPNLAPEKANTYGVGVVYQSSLIEGLSVSTDYWRVKIKDAIATVTAQQALQLCFDGNQLYCSFIVRFPGTPTLPGAAGTPYAGQFFNAVDTITTKYVNIATTTRDGIDISATYRLPLDSIISDMGGDLTMRWDQSIYFKTYSHPGVPGGLPTYEGKHWSGVGSITYSDNVVTAGLTGRVYPKSAYSFFQAPQIIECTAGCPPLSSIPTNFFTQDYLYKQAAIFFDANLSYSFNVADIESQLYLNVRNIFNRDPVLTPHSTQPQSFNMSFTGDDALGRIFRLGLRFSM